LINQHYQDQGSTYRS